MPRKSGRKLIKADWTSVQTQLDKVDNFDILLIMDCCYAAKSIKAVTEYTMEALYAVSREIEAHITKTGSLLTTALIKHLRNRASQVDGFLVSELNVDLHKDPGLRSQSPNHVQLRGWQQPIRLQPLNTTVSVQAVKPTQTDNRSGTSAEGNAAATMETFDSAFVGKYSVSIIHGHKLYEALSLLDVRAETNFVSKKFVDKLNLEFWEKETETMPWTFLDHRGMELHTTPPHRVRLGFHHDPPWNIAFEVEEGKLRYSQSIFYVIPDLPVDIVLGSELVLSSDYFTREAEALHGKVESLVRSPGSDPQVSLKDIGTLV